MVLTAHQPVYLPWLGLLHKIALADLFCFFDIVQYQRKDFNNRNKINTSNGPIWLTVPVKSSGRLNSVINDIEIIDNDWKKNHLLSIELNYKKTKYFDVNYLMKFLSRKYIIALYFQLKKSDFQLFSVLKSKFFYYFIFYKIRGFFYEK